MAGIVPNSCNASDVSIFLEKIVKIRETSCKVFAINSYINSDLEYPETRVRHKVVLSACKIVKYACAENNVAQGVDVRVLRPKRLFRRLHEFPTYVSWM